jgi:hypothetical protein
MSFLAWILSSFDEALDWPEDLLLHDDQPVEDWSAMPIGGGIDVSSPS